MTVSGATSVAAVIGSPIRHSLSPAIFNAAFAESGVDAVYLAFEVDAGGVADVIRAAKVMGFVGLSVTMPDKQAAAAAVDEITPEADALGAVNSVQISGDVASGHNTDGPGFLDALDEESGFLPAGRRVGIVGAGGAARAVILALAEAGAAEVVVVNRSAERAAAATGLHDRVRVGVPDELRDVDLVVNATPLGMGAGDPLPLPEAMLRPDQVVADLVYWPARTPLLRAAAARGATTVGGLGMLVHQAARSYRLWLDQEPPLAQMRRVAVECLEMRG